MPTLLQINVTVNTGSTGRIAEEIGRRALTAGYNSYIAYGRAARKSASSLIRIGSMLDHTWHGIVSLLFDAHGFGSKYATKRLIKQIDKIHPDVVLLHNLHGYYLNITVLLSYLKTKDIPTFWTLHDCWPFTGHCSHFMGVGCDKYETGCHNCPNRKAYPRSLFFDRSWHNYQVKQSLIQSIPNLTIITVCRWMDNAVGRSFMGGIKTKVIYNGVDVSTFNMVSAEERCVTKTKYQIPDKKIVLGVASTWKRKKAYYDFCWLNEQLSNDYQIVLIGLSTRQINKLPVGIIGLKRTENARELASLYSIANVFVNPTYVDTFPTTNIEALACGTPIVTYITGGSPEAIDRHTGVAIQKGDKEALKEAIIHVVASRNEYPAGLCRQRALDCFDKNKRFGDYIDLFNESLQHD